MRQYQYDGEKNGAQWRLIVKPYFISKAPEIACILKSIEDHEDQSATVSNLATRGLGVHPETIRSLSADLWGFLTLNLQGSARLWVNNSEPMEGFDIWRKLMKVVRSRSEIRRHELLSQLHRPNTAPKLSEVLLALERWDGSLREYIEAGGQPLPFEERRAAMLNILPAKFREDVFFRIPAMQESMAGDDGTTRFGIPSPPRAAAKTGGDDHPMGCHGWARAATACLARRVRHGR